MHFIVRHNDGHTFKALAMGLGRLEMLQFFPTGSVRVVFDRVVIRVELLNIKPKAWSLEIQRYVVTFHMCRRWGGRGPHFSPLTLKSPMSLPASCFCLFVFSYFELFVRPLTRL